MVVPTVSIDVIKLERNGPTEPCRETAGCAQRREQSLPKEAILELEGADVRGVFEIGPNRTPRGNATPAVPSATEEV